MAASAEPSAHGPRRRPRPRAAAAAPPPERRDALPAPVPPGCHSRRSGKAAARLPPPLYGQSLVSTSSFKNFRAGSEKYSIQLYHVRRKSEVYVCVNHSANKTKDAAASSLYKCNSLFTERIGLHAFSSSTIKTSHTHGENLCKCKSVHAQVRNMCNHRKSSPFILVIFHASEHVIVASFFLLSLMNYFGLSLLFPIYPVCFPGKAFKITAPIMH
ncbi:uncharacterized protein LOC114011335 isoform X1 [Falco peregrinus]|uniref:uncharacterized protein LOC114011335 isoform X1 n=1 Tax=Falco peregrinus TaxID=8954 RepID=UPI0024794B49|nr:uncharacterized protein LOC114011335 isoform X1 [Falco peregrinus]